LNAYQQHSNKNMSRSVAEGRFVGSTHRNLQELIENSPRVKQLNAYQKMADDYSSRQQNPVQQKQNDDRVNDRFTERKEIPAEAFSANKRTNEGLSETIPHINPVVQKAKRKVKAPAPVVKKNKIKPKIKKKVLPAKKQAMTVRNKTNAYTSGRINQVTRATGVDASPQKEAQKVAKFLGGSWVGGHMVNDQLGGTGDFSNIVPITSSMNGKHKTIENRANNELNRRNGTEVEYQMNINRRETRVHGLSTVKNLPVEFEQTLDVYPRNAAPYTVNGNVLTHP
jgi:hypothetical protein